MSQKAAVALFVVSLLLLAGSQGVRVAEGALVRFGGDVAVPTGEVADNVVVIGGSVRVDGEVTGDVVAIGGAVSISGTVQGDVTAVGGRVSLASTAKVLGDVTAVGGSVEREPGAEVGGEVSVVSFTGRFTEFFPGFRLFDWRWFSFPLTVLYLAGLFALALIVSAVIPQHVRSVEHAMEAQAGRSVVIGIVALLLLVPLTVLLALTIVGPVLLWLLFFAAKLLGYVATVNLIGRRVGQSLSGDMKPVWQLTLGVVLLAVLRYVPLLGWLLSLIVTVWSTGAVLDTKFGTNRPWLPPKTA